MRSALRRPLVAAVTAVSAAAATALLAPAAAAAPAPTTESSASASLRGKVTTEGILEHLRALEEIGQRNDDTRAAGTPGYDQSAAYVQQRLEAAGYQVTLDPFSFNFFDELAPATLTTGGRSVTTGTFTYSGNGTVTGTAVPVDLALAPAARAGSTSGCEAADFAGFPTGSVALIQRGTCTFEVKVANAVAAGASAVVVFNQGNTGRTDLFVGTLGRPFPIPVVGTSFADGSALAGSTVTVAASTVSEERTTNNVVADLVPSGTGRSGRGSDVVLVGAHLDSVPAGPGINDNGSGSATILEIAEQLAGRSGADKGNGLTNTVRFAWWSAEELGLLGSQAYVSQLRAEAPAELDRIALNLNFDMVASPNYARFVYDGDNSAFPVGAAAAEGPTGSGEIERVFTDYFASVGLASGETPFSGRSDYGPFIAAGVDIPAGGLFTGAEGVKTVSQVQYFGGKAGVAYDPCYHQFCDSLTGEGRDEAVYAGLQDLIGNVNVKGLDEMSDAAAHATAVFARRDFGKQPLVDPATPVTGVATTVSGGGLHDEDHDHEGERS